MAPTSPGAARLTVWTLGLGYVFSAAGPVLVGAARDATGGFTAPMLALTLLGAVPGVLGTALPRLCPASAGGP